MSACHAAMRLVAPRALRANAAAASKRRVERGPSPLEPSGAITTSAAPRTTSTPRRAVVARVSPPGSNAGPGGGHGAVGDGVVPDAAADAGARADWQAELAALESAAEERSASIAEMQAMLAGMGQPAPPPPPAETPPRATEVERAPADEATTSAHPAAAAAARSLDILPPPAPAAAPPPPPVPLAAPPVPIPAAAAPVPIRAAAPPPPPPPRVDASFAGEHRVEVAAMLAADAPATTSQQCTGEVTSLMHKMATTPIPPPLSTKRFKMVRPTSAPAPVTSAPEGTEATAPAPAPAPAAEKKKADDLAGAPPQVLAAMAGDAEGVAALDAADASLATSLAVEEAEATKSVLGDAEDALAEALALAADEDEDDEAKAAEAEVEAEVEDEVSVSVSVSASAFPPASEWVGADAPSDEPSAAPSDFPGRLSRAMRTITDWFTGVPFLDLYEAPAPEMATMTAAEMHLAAEERREMLARALRVVEIRPEASPSLSAAVAVTPPRAEPSADAYGMNPVEEIPAPEPETLEEMDYESYLAFHGMEILEGTPPQVVAAMVGDLDAANRADAEDARRAERRAEARRKEAELASVDAALAALMAKKDVTDEALEAAANDAEARMMNERLRGEDDRTADDADLCEYSDRSEDTGADAVLASELRAASAALAASEQRATELELSLAALAAEAEAAKAEASAHKRKLAAAYERGERVSELLAEVDRWKDAHDASESARAAYAEEQAERKRLFVAEADERLAEAKAQAERSDAERAALAAALEEANAKVATAESEVATDAEALRAARLASAAAAEDAAATITEAAERLLEAKARAAKLKRQMDEADAEIRDVRAELESAKYAAGEAAREAEAARGVAEEARMAAAAAALCVAVSVVAKLNKNELGEVILEEA